MAMLKTLVIIHGFGGGSAETKLDRWSFKACIHYFYFHFVKIKIEVTMCSYRVILLIGYKGVLICIRSTFNFTIILGYPLQQVRCLAKSVCLFIFSKKLLEK